MIALRQCLHQARGFRQRGAIGIMAATLLATLLLFMALAVDTGRLYMEKRRLQQQADLAAVQAAQLYCSGFGSLADIESVVSDRLDENGFDPTDTANTVTVQLGSLAVASNLRSFAAGGDPESVRVTLTRQVPSSLFAGSVFNPVTLAASATAKRDLQATLAAGTNLLTLDSSQSSLLNALLGGLLGSTVNIGLGGYQGLLDAQVTLLALRDNMAGLGLVATGAGLNDLLAVDLSLGDWLQVIHLALQDDGSVPSASLDAINELISLSTASGYDSRTLSLDDLFSYTDSGGKSAENALNTGISGLTLLTSSLLQINEGDDVGLTLAIDPSADALLNALLGTSLSVVLHIAAAPTIAIGPFGYDNLGLPVTEASAGDLDIQVDLQIPDPSASGSLLSLLTGALSVVASIEGDLALAVRSAGSAWLDRVDQCPLKLSRDIDYSVGSQSQFAIRVGSVANPSSPASLSVKLLLGLIPVEVTVQASVAPPETSDTQSYLVDLSEADALPQGASATTSLSDVLGSTSITVGGSLSLGILDALVSDMLRPLLVGVAELALDPLLDLLGLSLGEVEYQVMSIDEGQGEIML